MSPKSLLRHPMARSKIDDFLPETKFCRTIPETGEAEKSPDQVNRLVFCTGTWEHNSFLTLFFDFLLFLPEMAFSRKLHLPTILRQSLL